MTLEQDIVNFIAAEKRNVTMVDQASPTDLVTFVVTAVQHDHLIGMVAMALKIAADEERQELQDLLETILNAQRIKFDGVANV